jgi:dTMP kinase
VIDANCPCNPAQQALLYITARAALADEIRELLDQGVDVVCGRWTLSTLVYQGDLGKVGIAKIRWLTKNFVDLDPDIYILLNASPEIALMRKRQAVGDVAISNDRFDSRPIDWHKAVQNSYFCYAEGKSYPVVDADRTIDEVTAAVLAICKTDARLRASTGSL